VYLDQQGAQQGPFSTAEMRGWYTGGFFQGSLQVRPAAAAGEFAPLLSFSWLSGGDSGGVVEDVVIQDSGGRTSVSDGGRDDISATEGMSGTQRAPLSSQESMFGASQVADIAAGGSAQSARGQALFLQERLRQFEQQQQGQSDDGDVVGGRSTTAPVGASAAALESGGKVSTAPGATTSAIDTQASGKGRGRGKAKSGAGGGGGFLGMLKKQVKQTEKAQQRGISTDTLTLDATEKQGQNHGVFKYLLPPMGH
jgi:hypothetical protein